MFSKLFKLTNNFHLDLSSCFPFVICIVCLGEVKHYVLIKFDIAWIKHNIVQGVLCEGTLNFHTLLLPKFLRLHI
jgi:hypothetical protein